MAWIFKCTWMASVCFSQDYAKIYFPQLYLTSLWRANLQFGKFPVYSHKFPFIPVNSHGKFPSLKIPYIVLMTSHSCYLKISKSRHTACWSVHYIRDIIKEWWIMYNKWLWCCVYLIWTVVSASRANSTVSCSEKQFSMNTLMPVGYSSDYKILLMYLWLVAGKTNSPECLFQCVLGRRIAFRLHSQRITCLSKL